MKQTWTHFHFFPAGLAVSAAVACGCSVSDATLKLFASEGEAGGSGAGGDGDASGVGGAGGATPSLDCGNGTCPQGGDSACCWDSDRHTGKCIEGPPSDATCNTTQRSTDGRKTRIECELPSQCAAGEVCCAAVEIERDQLRYTSVTCASQCDWPKAKLCSVEDPGCPIVTTPEGTVQTVCAHSARFQDSYLVCGVP
jgi:hypothetical protein